MVLRAQIVGQDVAALGGGLLVIGEVIGTRQIRQVAVRVIELVDGGDQVAVVGILAVVDDVVVDGPDATVEFGMGIGVDGDGVVARLQHPRLGILVIIGGQVVGGEGEVDGLRFTRFEQVGFLLVQQVGGGLLDAAVGIGRVVVDLDHVLACRIAGVGDGHLE